MEEQQVPEIEAGRPELAALGVTMSDLCRFCTEAVTEEVAALLERQLPTDQLLTRARILCDSVAMPVRLPDGSQAAVAPPTTAREELYRQICRFVSGGARS